MFNIRDPIVVEHGRNVSSTHEGHTTSCGRLDIVTSVVVVSIASDPEYSELESRSRPDSYTVEN